MSKNPNAYMAYHERKDEQKSFWGRMGLLPKVIIAMAVILIITILIFGINVGNMTGFVMNVVGVSIGAGLIYFAIKGVLGEKEPEAFSITEDFRTKLVNQCVKLKPNNVFKLWIRGEGMRARAEIGNIVGLGYIPYKVSKPMQDEKGQVMFMKDSKGNTLKDQNGNPVPQYKLLYNEDGDTVFVVKTGLFGKPEIIRCHRKYHSELVGDVYIKDLGLIPFGEYFYPSKQWMVDMQEIMIQNEVEAMVQTFSNNLDLVANVTTMSIAGDPFYQKVLSLRNEEISRAPNLGTTPNNQQMQQR